MFVIKKKNTLATGLRNINNSAIKKKPITIYRQTGRRGEKLASPCPPSLLSLSLVSGERLSALQSATSVNNMASHLDPAD